MAPPDLPGHAPVLDIFHPGKIGVGPSLGNDADSAVADNLHCGFGQRLDVNEPLRRKIRLDHSLAAVAMAYRLPMWPSLFPKTLFPHPPLHLLSPPQPILSHL